jgi:hypothetical protein
MKKFLLASTLVSLALISQAQWFIGSGIDFHYNLDKSTTGKTAYSWYIDRDSDIGFSVAPLIGYQRDGFAIGGSVIFYLGTGLEKVEYPTSAELITREKLTKTTLFGVRPFIRHTVAEIGKFSILTNTGTHFLFGTALQDIRINNYSHGPVVRESEYHIMAFGINVTPVLSYSLSSRFEIEVMFNFMNLGFNVTTHRDKLNQYRDKHGNTKDDNDTKIAVGLGSPFGNLLNSTFVSVGVIYRLSDKKEHRRSFDSFGTK